MNIQFQNIQPGVYDARISHIQQLSGPYGDYLKFNFTILNGPVKGWKFYGIVKPYPLKESKLYRWIINTLRKEPDANFSINEMLEKNCSVSLNKKIKNNKTYFYVDDILDAF